MTDGGYSKGATVLRVLKQGKIYFIQKLIEYSTEYPNMPRPALFRIIGQAIFRDVPDKPKMVEKHFLRETFFCE